MVRQASLAELVEWKESTQWDNGKLIGRLAVRRATDAQKPSPTKEWAKRYRLKFADTYYGELNHYGMYWLKWANVRRAG